MRKHIAVLVTALLSVPAWAADPKGPGIPNFHKVNDRLYRGGQPNSQGWKSLADLGVKTVIDLRRQDEHSTAAEAQAVQAVGMRYVNVPMQGIVSPGDDKIARILSLLDSKDPVFVHCKAGKDRTGTVIACYRIARDRWQNQKALDEAKTYGMHWIEVGMKRYIMSFHAAPVLADLEPVASRP
jgi:protein tyrosine/serine phosphatase